MTPHPTQIAAEMRDNPGMHEIAARNRIRARTIILRREAEKRFRR